MKIKTVSRKCQSPGLFTIHKKCLPTGMGHFEAKDEYFLIFFCFIIKIKNTSVPQVIQAIIISITNVQVLHDNIAISSRFFCVLCSLFIYNTKLLSCTKGFPPYQISISLTLGPLLYSPFFSKNRNLPRTLKFIYSNNQTTYYDYSLEPKITKCGEREFFFQIFQLG